jgi:hypothetical protein
VLVVIRTFLSWLVVEIEERWPWQPPRVERTSRAEPTGNEGISPASSEGVRLEARRS